MHTYPTEIFHSLCATSCMLNHEITGSHASSHENATNRLALHETPQKDSEVFEKSSSRLCALGYKSLGYESWKRECTSYSGPSSVTQFYEQLLCETACSTHTFSHNSWNDFTWVHTHTHTHTNIPDAVCLSSPVLQPHSIGVQLMSVKLVSWSLSHPTSLLCLSGIE